MWKNILTKTKIFKNKNFIGLFTKLINTEITIIKSSKMDSGVRLRLHKRLVEEEEEKNSLKKKKGCRRRRVKHP